MNDQVSIESEDEIIWQRGSRPKRVRPLEPWPELVSDPPTSAEATRTPQLCRDRCVVRHADEVVRQVDKPTTIALLIAKLHSEVAELANNLTDPEEYGDVLDTLVALRNLTGVTQHSIDIARDKKFAKKGGLQGGKFWIRKEFLDRD